MNLGKAFVLLGIVLTLAACDNNESRLLIKGASEDIVIEVEVAQTSQEKAAGLMFRKTLKENQGMLFIYAIPQAPDFWMKNTYLSLDLIYIDQNNKIVAIKRGAKPHSEEIIPAPARVIAVLEVESGTKTANLIKAGQSVIHPLLKQ